MKVVRMAAAGLAVGLLAGGAGAQTVGIGTGPQGSLTNRIGVGVAKVASRVAKFNAIAQPYTGNQQHLPLVSSGKLQFGVNNIQEISAAVSGTDQFKGRKPFANMRVVTRLIPLPVGFLVRKSSNIVRIADLKGRRVPVGYTSQKTVINVVNALLAAGGLTVADVDRVLVPNTGRGTAAFMAGKADVAMSSMGGARLRKADAAVGGIRVLPIPDSPDAVAALLKTFPPAYILTLKPSKGLPGIDKPTRVMAYDFLLNSSLAVPEEIVYKVTKAMAESKSMLVDVTKAFRGFDPKKMAPDYPVLKFHPGAIRYYKEVGLWPPKS
jgi:uncharacterized protein